MASPTRPTDRVTSVLSPGEAHDLLVAHGLRLARQQVVADPEEVGAFAAEVGGPVVVKAVVPGLVHKADADAVRLGLATPEAAREAAAELAGRLTDLDGFLVQEQVLTSAVEVFVGMRRDPVFGPMVMVGLGGLFVEALEDVSMRPTPLTTEDAEAMIAELRAGRLLAGDRGFAPVDTASLAAAVVAVAGLAEAEPRVVELDLNPLLSTPEGVVAVDAHVVVADLDGPHPAVSAERRLEQVRRMMEPASIVVVGASTDPRKQGGRLLRYLLHHGYQGRLYAVNPRADEVMGVASYPSVADLPETPELACISVPAAHVIEAVRQCADRGVAAVITYTSGFADSGEEGRALQDELMAVVRDADMGMCGPNTAGVVNRAHRMCAAVGMAFEVDEMPAGSIAFLTQSGAMGSSLLSRSWSEGAGFSQWICCGNSADLGISEYLAYLAEDPGTDVIAVFMENVNDGPLFVEAARRARANGKAVVVYKTGRSELGRRAIESHTAALAGDDAVYDAVLRANGVVRVPDLQSLVDCAIALAWQPRLRGNRIGVISSSGGLCSVIADLCAASGLDLPEFSDAATEQISALVPPFGSPQNPVDVTIQITVQPEMIRQVMDTILTEDHIDALLIALTTNAGPAATEVAKGVTEVAARSDKPVVVVRMSSESLAPDAVAHYRDHHVPLFPMPERAIRALTAMLPGPRPAAPSPAPAPKALM